MLSNHTLEFDAYEMQITDLKPSKWMRKLPKKSNISSRNIWASVGVCVCVHFTARFMLICILFTFYDCCLALSLKWLLIRCCTQTHTSKWIKKLAVLNCNNLIRRRLWRSHLCDNKHEHIQHTWTHAIIADARRRRYTYFKCDALNC